MGAGVGAGVGALLAARFPALRSVATPALGALAGGAIGDAATSSRYRANVRSLHQAAQAKTAAAEYSTRGRPPKPLKTTTHGEAVRHIQNQLGEYETKIDTKVAMVQDARRDLLNSLRTLTSG